MKWWHVYVAGWLAATVLGALSTAICRVLAPRLGLIDTPEKEAHKRHVRVTPVMGGVGMLSAWLAAIALGLAVFALTHGMFASTVGQHLAGIRGRAGQLLTMAAVASFITLVGVVDDRRSLRPGVKFGAQILAALVTAAMGIRITAFIPIPGASWVLTVLWIAGIINAINFMDNMDGLAGGTAAIAALFFLLTAAVREQYFVAVLGSVTCGAACGFLIHNRPPARIFMGDAGSHFLGYILAVLGALTTFYMPNESPTPAPILMPLLILGLPIFDAAAVVLLRLREGRPIYIGDNTHISHRFAWLGLSRGKAVLLACLLSFCVGCGAVALLWLPVFGAVLVLLQAGGMLAIVSIIQFCAPEAKERSC